MGIQMGSVAPFPGSKSLFVEELVPNKAVAEKSCFGGTPTRASRLVLQVYRKMLGQSNSASNVNIECHNWCLPASNQLG